MMQRYAVHSDAGWRVWTADDIEHAQEQHDDAFPDEQIIAVMDEDTARVVLGIFLPYTEDGECSDWTPGKIGMSDD